MFILIKIFTIITNIFHVVESLGSQAMELLIIQKHDLEIIATYCYNILHY